MKYVVLIAACALMSGCGDADEDTGDDTVAVAEQNKCRWQTGEKSAALLAHTRSKNE